MRTALLKEITTLAETNQDLMLVVGDLGFGVVEEFAIRYPERFLNAGVAEQNMASVAAGLAHSGMRPIIYSIANFPTLRCLEQIRNDIVYHSLPVIIVSVGAGLSYGSLGYSHFAIEDMAIMGSLPNLSLFSPSDPAECRASLRTAFASNAPSYIRIGRTGEPALHDPAVQLSVQRPLVVHEGSDVSVVATGPITHEAVEAARVLADGGLSVRVISVPQIEPFDGDSLLGLVEEFDFIVTVEEHSVSGGLGTRVAVVLAEAGHVAAFRRIGLPQQAMSDVGSQAYLRSLHGLDVPGLTHAIRTFLNRNVYGRNPTDG